MTCSKCGGPLDRPGQRYCTECHRAYQRVWREAHPPCPDPLLHVKQSGMDSTVTHNNKSDDLGRPAGGTTHGRGFAIAWQDGPLGTGDGRIEPNGAFVEDVITAAIGRMEHYQASPFACDENQRALDHLIAAREALRERTAGRENRGVEGTHEI